MVIFTDDPVRDYEAYSAEREAELNRLPKCIECGEPIQQTDASYINGGFICDECIEDLRREVMLEW